MNKDEGSEVNNCCQAFVNFIIFGEPPQYIQHDGIFRFHAKNFGQDLSKMAAPRRREVATALEPISAGSLSPAGRRRELSAAGNIQLEQGFSTAGGHRGNLD